MLQRVTYTLLVFLGFAFTAKSQDPVAPCTDWVATVDEITQQIVLRWRPSADSAAMGYHICTGSPCLDYDTVFGRLDTTYTCVDHSPLEEHTYRLHVFDTSYNVSALTPSFGNIVLHADIPDCSTFVNASWNAYTGMPEGVGGYRLMVRVEPHDSIYYCYYSAGPDGTLAYSFEIPGNATHVHLMVEAYNTLGTLVSHSNIVSVARQTIDTAAFVEITSVEYDSLNNAIRLHLHTDTSYHGADHHTLWRSIDGSPWRVLSTGNWEEYIDFDINRFDSLHCYQLSVFDACGLNEKFSATACTVVPDPPEPGAAIPNIIIAGDPDNGQFRPQVESLNGDLYELTIYNRNGLQMFATTDPTAAWEPSDAVQQGAYTYVLRVRYTTGIIHSYVGTFLVIK